MSTKWTDPARVKSLHKPTRWMDPARDQDSCPQSGRTQLRPNNLHNWTDPTRVKDIHKSTRWTDPTKVRNFSPQNGRAPQEYTIRPNHKVDGYMFHKCTDLWMGSLFKRLSK